MSWQLGGVGRLGRSGGTNVHSIQTPFKCPISLHGSTRTCVSDATPMMPHQVPCDDPECHNTHFGTIELV